MWASTLLLGPLPNSAHRQPQWTTRVLDVSTMRAEHPTISELCRPSFSLALVPMWRAESVVTLPCSPRSSFSLPTVRTRVHIAMAMSWPSLHTLPPLPLPSPRRCAPALCLPRCCGAFAPTHRHRIPSSTPRRRSRTLLVMCARGQEPTNRLELCY
jgi:hypothetical protein